MTDAFAKKREEAGMVSSFLHMNSSEAGFQASNLRFSGKNFCICAAHVSPFGSYAMLSSITIDTMNSRNAFHGVCFAI